MLAIAHELGIPVKLVGVGEGIEDLREMKRLGLRGVMMPGNPAVADYDDPIYAPFYEAAVDLGIADRIRFRGYVTDPVPFLRRAAALF